MVIVESHVTNNAAGNNAQSSNSVILNLVRGDTVYTGDCTSVGTFWVKEQTSFSGFLLQED